MAEEEALKPSFDGETYVMETGLVADLAIVKAWKGDRDGNLVYRKTARNFNPPMAMAGKVTVAAKYNLLRKNGHSPSEAFNETVEELTQSLIRLVAENGMDWMFANCSTTAQRGALDWAPRFRDAVAPVFATASATVSNTGRLRCVSPPLFGVTPPTMRVP